MYTFQLLTADLSVPYLAVGLEADFVNRTVDLTFNAATTSIVVSIMIIDDAYLEFDEPFSSLLTLTTVTPDITLDPDHVIITILNDDSMLLPESNPECSSHTCLSIPIVLSVCLVHMCPLSWVAHVTHDISINILSPTFGIVVLSSFQECDWGLSNPHMNLMKTMALSPFQ